MTFVGNDLKYSLRKREFPFCARDALTRAEELLIPPNSNRTHFLMQTELAMEIIAEFVFNDDERKGYRKKLTNLQELELMQVICDHMMFDGGGNEASRNAVFLLLFPAASTDRVRILVSLVSLAASIKNIPVLNAAGILMQQVNSTSQYSSRFAQGLVNEYFLLVPKSAPCVLDLPKVAPLFSAHFLTAATEAYGFSTGDKQYYTPPKHLLEIILQWVDDNETLCLSPLLNKLQPALPQGGIPMPATTPYAGLFRWCILSWLVNNEEEIILYSKLHSRLLESLVVAEKVSDRMPNVLSAQNLASIIPSLCQAQDTAETGYLNTAIKKLAETVEVAVESNTLYGPKQDLWRQLKMLPHNEKLNIVLEKHSALV